MLGLPHLLDLLLLLLLPLGLLLCALLLRVVLLRLPLFLVLLFGRLWPAFVSLVLCLLVVLFLSCWSCFFSCLSCCLSCFLSWWSSARLIAGAPAMASALTASTARWKVFNFMPSPFSDVPRDGPKVACRCPHTR